MNAILFAPHQVQRGLSGRLGVVGTYCRTIYVCHSVEQHQRDVALFDSLQVSVVCRLLGETHGDALHMHVLQQFKAVGLRLRLIVGIGYNAHIAIVSGLCLYALDDMGIMGE